MPQPGWGIFPSRLRYNSNHRITLTEEELLAILKQQCQRPIQGGLATRTRFTNQELLNIANSLVTLDRRAQRPRELWWSSRPRIFTILCAIDALALANEFAACGINDINLPYEFQTLPNFIHDNETKLAFLRFQDYVLSPDKDLIQALELGEQHVSFSMDADMHFISAQKKGDGGYGTVDSVCGKLTGNWYARKKVHRRADSKQGRRHLKFIEQEIELLKMLSHRHLIKIGGSYTDPKCVAYLMQPIAEWNLFELLGTHYRGSPAEKSAEVRLLRGFYGCLASAVDFLHASNVVHRDLKPQNVLVHHDGIYVADFGAAIDWAVSNESETQGSNAPKTREYMAPEVANGNAKDFASDMWSLGMIFLDMFTVLMGSSHADWRKFLQDNARRRSKEPYAYQNVVVICDWLQKLSDKKEAVHRDLQAVAWIEALLKEKHDHRPRTKRLIRMIAESEDANEFCCCKCQQDFRSESFFSEHQGQGDIKSQVQGQQSRLDEMISSSTSNMPQRQMSSEKAQSINKWLGLEGHKVPNLPEKPSILEPKQLWLDGNYVHSPAASDISQHSVKESEEKVQEYSQLRSFDGGFETSLFYTVEGSSSNGDDSISINERVDSLLDAEDGLGAIMEEDENVAHVPLVPEISLVTDHLREMQSPSTDKRVAPLPNDSNIANPVFLELPKPKSRRENRRARSASPARVSANDGPPDSLPSDPRSSIHRVTLSQSKNRVANVSQDTSSTSTSTISALKTASSQSQTDDVGLRSILRLDVQQKSEVEDSINVLPPRSDNKAGSGSLRSDKAAKTDHPTQRPQSREDTRNACGVTDEHPTLEKNGLGEGEHSTPEAGKILCYC